jgi:hypothetical protein
MSFASDKNAFGISDRSGFRYRLRDMRKEWTGALVGSDEYEPKHPQLYPPRPGPLQVYVDVPTVEAPSLVNVRMIGKAGQVTVVTT